MVEEEGETAKPESMPEECSSSAGNGGQQEKRLWQRHCASPHEKREDFACCEFQNPYSHAAHDLQGTNSETKKGLKTPRCYLSELQTHPNLHSPV